MQVVCQKCGTPSIWVICHVSLVTIANCKLLGNYVNIFKKMNMKNRNFDKPTAEILKVLSSPFRIRLLYTIGLGEACVCHLETVMKKRQAYISQHLMVLRDAGILQTRREGRYIFYRIASEDVFKLVEWAAKVGGVKSGDLPQIDSNNFEPECVCPQCIP